VCVRACMFLSRVCVTYEIGGVLENRTEYESKEYEDTVVIAIAVTSLSLCAIHLTSVCGLKLLVYEALSY
jgi:hypothetical protein